MTEDEFKDILELSLQPDSSLMKYYNWYHFGEIDVHINSWNNVMITTITAQCMEQVVISFCQKSTSGNMYK